MIIVFCSIAVNTGFMAELLLLGVDAFFSFF